jgi:hypothetical protein
LGSLAAEGKITYSNDPSKVSHDDTDQ